MGMLLRRHDASMSDQKGAGPDKDPASTVKAAPARKASRTTK